MSQLVIQQGLKKDEERGVINAHESWTGETIVAKSVDSERDEKIGVNLSKYNLNLVFAPKDHRDRKFSARYTFDPATLPTKYDEISKNWGDILDQGDLGSCVSNSVAYAIRYTRYVEKLPVFNPSRLFIYYYGRVIEGSPANEDTGLYIRDGYKSVANYSVCGEANWPYDTSKFAIEPSKYAQDAAKQHKKFQYLAVNQNLNELKYCLSQGYPISFGITVFESFMSADVARTGVWNYPNINTEQQLGGHAVTLVGYDDSTRRFKVSNSWGKDWGDQGFFYMPYDYVLNWRYCDDFWTPRVFI